MNTYDYGADMDGFVEYMINCRIPYMGPDDKQSLRKIAYDMESHLHDFKTFLDSGEGQCDGVIVIDRSVLESTWQSSVVKREWVTMRKVSGTRVFLLHA